jgi:hypothetical protein
MQPWSCGNSSSPGSARRRGLRQANYVKLRLDLAEARADEPIRASCYCRMTKAA